MQTGLDTPFLGAVALPVRRAGISEIGRIIDPGMTHSEPARSPGAPINRSVVVGDTLFTVSAAGVKASDLATFAGRGFASLPRG